MQKRYLAVVILCLCSLWSIAQKPAEVCSFEDGKFTILVSRNWTPQEINKVNQDFALDTAIIGKALRVPALKEIKVGEDRWLVSYPDNAHIKLTKEWSDMMDKDFKTHGVLYDPDMASARRTGPGYVDYDAVISGINKLKKPVIVQFPGGKVKFILPEYPNAKAVFLSGSFNDWSTSRFPMRKTDQGWEIELELKPGKHLYKYIVDGKWVPDPNNKVSENDGYGNANSVVYRYNNTFKLPGYADASSVLVTGSFNSWNEKELKMIKTTEGWVLPMYVKTGTHAYKFIVDKEWILDPNNGLTRPDGGGNFNSFLSIGKPYRFQLDGYVDARNVFLAGSFNSWNPGELGMSKTKEGWELNYVLDAGNYEYKFVVDGQWVKDVSNPYSTGRGDYENSFLAYQTNHVFALSGHDLAKEVVVTGSFTGWSEENYRMVRKNGRWEFPIYLKPGKYSYKFRVDGKWILDPNNPLFEENEFDTGNSVLWIEVDNDL